MKMKLLCLFTVVLLTLPEWQNLSEGAAARKPAVKPGICPWRKWGSGICAEYCTKDNECPKQQKCCSNGCGHECMIPYTVKPGVCPRLDGGFGTCAEYCTEDSECPKQQKCCSNGCGHECMIVY